MGSQSSGLKEPDGHFGTIGERVVISFVSLVMCAVVTP